MAAPVEFLDLLSADDRRELERLSRRILVARGEVLLRQGDPEGRIYVQLSGCSKVILLAAGEETLLAVRGPGSLLGDQALIARGRRSATVVAMEPLELLSTTASRFRAFLSQRPAVMLALLDVLSTRLRASDRRLAEFAAADTLGRVSARLVELSESHGIPAQDGAVRIALAISQEELAAWSGASLESTAKALRILRRLGRITTGRRLIEIQDLPGLRTHAPSQPSPEG
jgi:CRP/FNR family cyclic AMP-dependent transcriptional regulator